jgi:AhpD family alkylhydroperoxidase
MTQRINYDEISPAGSQALADVYRYVLQCGLPLGLVELVYLRVSQINNCAFCLDMHTRDLLKRGVSMHKLALVQAWREAGELFNDQERAALSWAESVTKVADTGVPDEDFHHAKRVFSDKELVDLTMAISLMNAYNRMAISFRNVPLAAL